MELLHVNNLSFKYEMQKDWFLKDINFTLNEGEVILITGPTGCGKSTLINCINGLLTRVLPGELKGDIQIINQKLKDMKISEISTKVGTVFQNPETQLFGLTVEEDVAFGPENLGIPPIIIKERIISAMKKTDILNLRERFVHVLSQGQKQRLAISGVLAMEPQVLIFDEPTSDLDPKGTLEVLHTIKKLSEIEKKGIILIEHKLDNIIDIVNKIFIMNEGRIILAGEPKEILKENNSKIILQLGVNIPNIISQYLDNKDFLNLRELDNFYFKSNHPTIERENVIKIQDLFFSYDKSNVILKDINLEIKENEFIALLGENGSGKSTLAKCLNGLLKPTSGRVFIGEHDTSKEKISRLSKIVGYLFQNPNHQIIKTTVYDEIALGLKNFKYKKPEIEKKINQILSFFNLLEYKFSPIFRLSRGQRQLITLASILVLEPKILILDEPTTGQDYKNRLLILNIAQFLNKMGIIIILITHDMELAYKFVRRIILINKGKIVKDGTPEKVFEDKDFLMNIGLDQPHSLKS